MTYHPFVGERRLAAFLWITGASLPCVLGAALLIGCCVLPFHGVAQELLPLCHTAAALVGGQHTGDQHPDSHPAEPAGERQQDGGAPQRTAAQPHSSTIFPATPSPAGLNPPMSAATYRSQISLGALRCDDDVGQHLALLDTFRI